MCHLQHILPRSFRTAAASWHLSSLRSAASCYLSFYRAFRTAASCHISSPKLSRQPVRLLVFFIPALSGQLQAAICHPQSYQDSLYACWNFSSPALSGQLQAVICLSIRTAASWAFVIPKAVRSLSIWPLLTKQL